MRSRLLKIFIPLTVFLALAIAVMGQQVKRVVRKKNSVHYLIEQNGATRNLHLYNYDALKAGMVTNAQRQILSMTVSFTNPTNNVSRNATFVFTANANAAPDKMSREMLKREAIAQMPASRRTKRRDWKNSTIFLDAMTIRDKPILVPGGLMTVAKARGGNPVKDAFCDPGFSVQLNSALNACFRAMCDYIECVEKSGKNACFDEESKASAFCFASGNNEFIRVD